MNYTPKDHTFAICAYGESRYLEECIASLEAQTVKTRMIMSTSTPSDFLRKVSEAHGIPLVVNTGKKGIGPDWNYAYNHAETPLVTIAHQDDIYEPEYAARMLEDLNASRNPILWFSGYRELRGSEKVANNKNLRIKRLMLWPLRGRLLRGNRFVRRRILSLGSPICCPAVTYVKERCGAENIFSTEMKVSLDWDQWEIQSRKKGAFVYRAEPLMCHRVHEESETTKLIASNTRGEEDLQMFRRFWPEPIAKRLGKAYAASEKSNKT
ncbi:MAG: glycosyltransferase family 2 protein [Clostridia bacterium]|nr:glycosyltransferase family 2 protein [Clostridia bacterium]